MTLFLHAFQTFVNEMFADVEILLCASQMWSSLSRLSSLPDDTRVFCGHEYTVVKCKSASLCRLHAFRTRFLFRLPDNALEFQTGLPCFLYSNAFFLQSSYVSSLDVLSQIMLCSICLDAFIYSQHYQANARFTVTVDPKNVAFQLYKEVVEQLRQKGNKQ